MGTILIIMLVVGNSFTDHTDKTSVAISQQRYNTLEACKAAGELAKLHATQLTPNARNEPGRYLQLHGTGARVVYVCAPEG